MGKFDPYSRRELRQRQRRWLRRNARVVIPALAVMFAATAVGTTLAAVTMSGPQQWYLLGFVHALVLAVAFNALYLAFLAHDKEAIHHVRGAWGEDNTRDVLRRAQRRRLIWGWVDSIGLRAGDLDHVVVTRHGGLVVIDSKWRNDVNAGGIEEMTRSALRAKSRAEALALTLLKKEGGARHRAKVKPLSVTPLVVLWGAAQRHVPSGAVVDGVEYVGGCELIEWLKRLEGTSVPKESAADVLDQMKRFRKGTSHRATARSQPA